MNVGLLGRKIGMTSIFNDEGKLVPVSVVEVLPNRITQIKTLENEGYHAIQVLGGTKKAQKVNKPTTGHFAKANVEPGDMLREFHVSSSENYSLGQVLAVADIFVDGQYLDVIGVSKGKGYAGTVKRHNFRTQDATHGNSLSHRAPGSIGQNQSPGRVFKGKKMSGQLGNKRCTVQNCKLVKIDQDRNLLLIMGSVPGAPGSKVIVKPAVKKQEERA